MEEKKKIGRRICAQCDKFTYKISHGSKICKDCIKTNSYV